MEDTCRKEKCPMWGLFKDPEEPCINYVQTWWEDKKTGETKLISDCVPKRIFLMLQHLMNRLDGVQEAAEKERNKTHELIYKLEGMYKKILLNDGTINMKPIEDNSITNLIENKDKEE